MSVISFEVPGVAVAKGRGRAAVVAGHAHVFTPAKTREAEQTFVARSLEFRPPYPLTGPILLSLTFILPIPKSAPKKTRMLMESEAALGHDQPHTKRPDLDNLVKLVKDACNGVFWMDDSQVYAIGARKLYGAIPRTIVRIEEVLTQSNRGEST
jgi:Holliday junction resolvase RusA-like endonuclease